MNKHELKKNVEGTLADVEEAREELLARLEELESQRDMIHKSMEALEAPLKPTFSLLETGDSLQILGDSLEEVFDSLSFGFANLRNEFPGLARELELKYFCLGTYYVDAGVAGLTRRIIVLQRRSDSKLLGYMFWQKGAWRGWPELKRGFRPVKKYNITRYDFA